MFYMLDKQMDRRSKRTRLAISTALVELILEKGYDDVTINDIVARADYNRGTFYKHYSGKDELLQEMNDEFLEGLGQALLEPYANYSEIEVQEVVPSTPRIFEHIFNNRQIFKALTIVNNNMLGQLYELFRSFLREHIYLEVEESPYTIDYEIMLSYEMSATVGVIMYWAETGFKYSPDYMVEQFTALVNVKPMKLVFVHSKSAENTRIG